jgi:hypothetical protein
MRQIEQTKKEYIDKLKKELDGVEDRYMKLINQNCMVGEDYRSLAYRNYETILNHEAENEKRKAE